MRKFSLFFLLSILFHPAFCQEGLLQFTANYFRSNPFIGEYSQFVRHLMNDPDLQEKQTLKRTDTSLFSFTGSYKTFNPFFFKPRKLKITLEETPAQFLDSLPPDTLLVYHLMAYAGNDVKAGQDIQKEFAKLHKQFKRKFAASNFQEISSETIERGAVHNYFVGNSDIAPLTIAWAKLNQEYVLDLILRIKVSENFAVLPTTFNDP
ncbi:MAG: hypothetical protein EOO01_27230 [Chitinophagaceae bacterium]|nr:MAG: hypothetical protein EOO01_27230 [Chitinophagaceae bacterium]